MMMKHEIAAGEKVAGVRQADEARAPLRVEAASVRYGAMRALDGVDLVVGASEVFALVGPNGAGKTTLVKAICGRTLLAAGAIHVGGAPAGSRAARRTIGVAPQRAALYDNLTALENVMCFARLCGVPPGDCRARARAALDVAGLSRGAGTLAGRLSGGQRQRANIAAAIVHAPSLLILDEPAAALDPEGVAETNALVARLRGEAMAILVVTHDMTQADEIADRVGVMRSGRLVVAATPAALKARFGGEGLGVAIDADEAAAAPLSARGFVASGRKIWRGRAASHGEVAALIEALTADGALVRTVETTAPSLATAVAAALLDEGGRS